MAALLGLMAALGYGVSDFCAGVSARRLPPGLVTTVSQVCALAATVVAVAVLPGHGPRPAALAWGALSGLGGGAGTMALYRGLSVGDMSLVATMSAVLTAVIPAVTGVALGNHPSTLAVVGILIAVPSIGLVSWQPSSPGTSHGGGRAGLGYGALAGVGFGVLFIALDRAGTGAGAWPLLPAEAVAVALGLPFGLRHLGAARRPAGSAGGRTARRRGGSGLALGVAAGVLGGTGNLLFLIATGHGQLTVVAVLTALYPAATVILARVLLGEEWTRLQVAGMVLAAAAIGLVSSG